MFFKMRKNPYLLNEIAQMVHSFMFLLTCLIDCANLKDYWDALQNTQHIIYVGSVIRLDICFPELFLKAVFLQKRLINISKRQQEIHLPESAEQGRAAVSPCCQRKGESKNPRSHIHCRVQVTAPALWDSGNTARTPELATSEGMIVKTFGTGIVYECI